ncbi:PREDICTED: uncharacterized protein LOC109462400 [Branchiostoma belcheri]|uniref:Uncharacterized protein LOC109462400 n=1 Tax=Branchiostoma belcheri TaxID=7741 RepID=A0A6P4XV57_BRABE|nr:PREDICTED: uncharacterized protein LOC109462400 [Branchiostoma belcheri]
MRHLLLSLSLVAAAWCAFVPANKLTKTTTTSPGCYYYGHFYQLGEVVVSETGCWGRTYTCEANGIMGHGIPGEDCCTHEGEYHDDGEIFFDSAGQVCHCFGNSTASPVPTFCQSLSEFMMSG